MTELTLPDHDPLRTISNYPMNNPPHFAPTLQSHAATAMHAPPPAFPSPPRPPPRAPAAPRPRRAATLFIERRSYHHRPPFSYYTTRSDTALD